MKKLIVDLDDTLSFSIDGDYANAVPNNLLIEKLRQYRDDGFQIIIFSSRNMRTFENNIGKINIHTLPVIIDWLNKFNVPFDEVHIGKPWCGYNGFYIDDKALRPSEFLRYTYDEILDLLGREKN